MKTVTFVKKNILRIEETSNKRKIKRIYYAYTEYLERTDLDCKRFCPVYKKCQIRKKGGENYYCSQSFCDSIIGPFLRNNNIYFFFPIYKEDPIYEEAEEL